MFTGIVTDVGVIRSETGRFDPASKTSLKRLRIGTRYDAKTIDLGASIMVNGICLTVVGRDEDWFEVEVGPETLKITTAGGWKTNTKVNLERSLKAGDELGGHLVSGHVDGIAEVLGREDLDQVARITMRAPENLARFIAVKGSVALDGISLTVNEVKGAEFSVLLIPHTLQVTNWSGLKAGDRINLEVDQIARYVARLAEFK
ncbi:MAG: riboflavin synthase [Xanthobacteraceae bacterium]|nr:riboflavin synthase [Xanthobacteraceae bacterium]QYK43698.1 MAG: riboflavin synthase [Xanthobacteraceae bacterium]